LAYKVGDVVDCTIRSRLVQQGGRFEYSMKLEAVVGDTPAQLRACDLPSTIKEWAHEYKAKGLVLEANKAGYLLSCKEADVKAGKYSSLPATQVKKAATLTGVIADRTGGGYVKAILVGFSEPKEMIIANIVTTNPMLFKRGQIVSVKLLNNYVQGERLYGTIVGDPNAVAKIPSDENPFKCQGEAPKKDDKKQKKQKAGDSDDAMSE